MVISSLSLSLSLSLSHSLSFKHAVFLLDLHQFFSSLRILFPISYIFQHTFHHFLRIHIFIVTIIKALFPIIALCLSLLNSLTLSLPHFTKYSLSLTHTHRHFFKLLSLSIIHTLFLQLLSLSLSLSQTDFFFLNLLQ